MIYDGESEVTWDAAETQREGGQIIFVDEDHNYVLENEIEWRTQ